MQRSNGACLGSRDLDRGRRHRLSPSSWWWRGGFTAVIAAIAVILVDASAAWSQASPPPAPKHGKSAVGTDHAASHQPRRAAGRSRKATPEPSKYQAQADELSKQAKLPAPPNLRTLRDEFSELLVHAIEDVANNPTAQNLGHLGCLYMTIAKTRDDFERPIACFERAKSLDPGSYKWPYYLGRVFFQRQSLERARSEFRKVLELNPGYAIANAWIGEIELVRDGSEEAKSAFEKYIEKRPDDGYGYVGLASALIQLEDFDGAAKALDKVRELLPGSGRAALLQAEIYEHQGDIQKASALRANRDKLTEMPLRLERDPLELELWMTLGPTNLAVQRVASMAGAGRVRDADLLADALMKKYPNSAELIAGIADVKKVYNDLDGAIKLAEQALQVQSDYAPAEAVLASCYLSKNDYPASLAHADKAIAMDADFVAGYVARGKALLAMDRGEEAVKSLRRAAELETTEPLYEMFVGDALASMGQWSQAKEAYEETLRRMESTGKIQQETFGVFAMLARIEYNERDVDAAISHLKRALRVNPGSEATLGPLMDLLLEADRSEEAIGVCRQYLRRSPRNDLYRQTLGRVLLRAGQVDEAMAHTQKWIEDSPKDPNALLMLSAVQMQRDDRDAAAQALHKAIELEPAYLPAYLQLMTVLITADPPDRDGAIAALREGLKNIPESVAIQNSLAWMLATHHDESKRAPQEAVKLAEQACDATERKQANILDTLACAYAAAGRFDEAIAAEKEAIDLLKQQDGAETTIKEFAKRIELFEKKQPYVE